MIKKKLHNIYVYIYINFKIICSHQRRFYGPVERTMLFSGLLRLSVIKKILDTRKKGVDGNMKGEGRILGGKNILCAWLCYNTVL